MSRAEHIEHTGRVLSVEGDTVRVVIVSQSACGSCRARQACGLAEAQEKEVTVVTADACRFASGDEVTVGVRRSAGLRAVALGYVGALVVLLAVLGVTIGLLGWNEGAGALAALGGVGIYYLLLASMKKYIENSIKFTITKNQ